ncbi:response regulator [Candidatus Scalindua japonica]|uniref:Response regulator n=1 Tax=Candidatus Scalindua japonica TaxID=1284222 RepID=A0A286TWT2_9BACT|nr:sigma-54 dependent transcriptional regulator [Candidatus Scalindua japonica]GAX60346.1 response regulator [Candidatus Scalindua japonica]
MNYRKNRILVIDDEPGWCTLLKSGLQEHDLEVEYETEAENALKAISSFKPDAVLLDVLFGNVSKGKLVFKHIKKSYPNLTIIMLSSTVADDDFMLKDYPECAFAFAKNQLNSGIDGIYRSFTEKIRRAIRNTEATSDSLQKEFDFVIGKTTAMKKVCKDILNAAATNATILITGESGVGKGLIASAIKDNSNRSDKQFVIKSCTDFPSDNILISELFGHEKGAFTGAEESHHGILEEACGGTVFIDEIGDASLEAQGRLLRFLQEKTIRRMKGKKDIKIDARVIMATNKNLQSLIRADKFREDLFYRLNQYKILVPSLRERKDDIPDFLAYFIRKFNKEDDKNILVETKNGEKDYLRADVLELLKRYDWPGNIREFENTVRRAMINAGDSNILQTDYFDFDVKGEIEKQPSDIEKLIDEIFKKKWRGKDKWMKFAKIYTTNGGRKEILQKCVQRLKSDRQNSNIRYQDLADLFGITENNMRQQFHVLEINWKDLKK